MTPARKILYWAWIAVLLGSPPLLQAGTEESEASTRLSAEANDFLDQILGPGRAKAIVTVQGEKSEIQTESELLTPIQRKDASKILPGYVVEAESRIPLDYVQKDKEHSVRNSGFIIKSIHVSVMLDTLIPREQEDSVRRLLPDFLRMNADRGDVMTIMRAPMLPPWKRTMMAMTSNVDGMKTLAIIAGLGILGIWVAVLAVWLSIVAYIIVMRAVKTFVRELSKNRPTIETKATTLPGALPGVTAAGELPEIGADGLPVLGEEDSQPGAAQPLKALGRRFDFLASQETAITAEILVKESPQDLALLFSYMTDTDPDLSSRLFAALPLALQGEVSGAMVSLTVADPERLAMLESKLKTAVEFGVRGHDSLGRILSRLPAPEREELMGNLMSRDQSGAEKVERSLFPFEKIAQLPIVELRRLLACIPHQDWGVALRGAPQEIIDPIMAQLPAGTREMVREVIETQQPRDKILEVRSKILSQAFSMAGRGLLTLKREGDDSPELI